MSVKPIVCFEKYYKNTSELLKEYNITRSCFDGRIKRGYSVEEAVTLTREQTLQNSLSNFNINHKNLSKDEVVKRFNNLGYTIIDYTYQTNQSALLCYDENGYKVKSVLARIEKGWKPFIFSVTYNEENFIYNINKYIENNNLDNKAIDWKMGKHNQPNVLFKCKCGNTYWANFNNWLQGERFLCQKCRKSVSTYEEKVAKYLQEENIKFTTQKTFPKCKYKNDLRFDFYLDDFNLCIEIDGEQHFKKIPKFEKPSENYDIRCKRDEIKTNYCKNNNILLLRIPYWNFKNDKYKEVIKNFILNI